MTEKNARTLFTDARRLHASNKHQEAIRAFEQAIELDPTYAKAWFYLAKLHKELGNEEEVIRCASKASEIEPKWFQHVHSLTKTKTTRKKDKQRPALQKREITWYSPIIGRLGEAISHSGDLSSMNAMIQSLEKAKPLPEIEVELLLAKIIDALWKGKLIHLDPSGTFFSMTRIEPLLNVANLSQVRESPDETTFYDVFVKSGLGADEDILHVEEGTVFIEGNAFVRSGPVYLTKKRIIAFGVLMRSDIFKDIRGGSSFYWTYLPNTDSHCLLVDCFYLKNIQNIEIRKQDGEIKRTRKDKKLVLKDNRMILEITNSRFIDESLMSMTLPSVHPGMRGTRITVPSGKIINDLSIHIYFDELRMLDTFLEKLEKIEHFNERVK